VLAALQKIEKAHSSKNVAVTSFGDSIRVFNLKSKRIKSLKGHKRAVTRAAFSADGRRILTGSGDGTVILWDINTDSSRIVFKSREVVHDINFSPNAKQIVIALPNGTIQLITIGTGCIREFKGNEGIVDSAIFNSDGSKILTVSSDGTSRIWNVSTGTSQVLGVHQKSISSASFSPDSSKVLTCSRDKEIGIWDLNTGGCQIIRDHKGFISSARFSHDGRYLLTASEKVARLWKISTDTFCFSKDDRSYRLRQAIFSPNGRHLFIAASDDSLDDSAMYLWDLDSSKLMVLEGHKRAVRQACFSSDGTNLATVSFDGTAMIWRLETVDSEIFAEYVMSLNSIEFSPDGLLIAMAQQDCTVKLHNFSTGKIKSLQAHKGSVEKVVF
jgi:WD40 repeat protein